MCVSCGHVGLERSGKMGRLLLLSSPRVRNLLYPPVIAVCVVFAVNSVCIVQDDAALLLLTHWLGGFEDSEQSLKGQQPAVGDQ